MVAGIPINVTNHANFALNTTYDFHTNGSRSGLVVGIPTGQYPHLYEASIAHNLSLVIKEGFANQTINVKAYNDFSAY